MTSNQLPPTRALSDILRTSNPVDPSVPRYTRMIVAHA